MAGGGKHTWRSSSNSPKRESTDGAGSNSGGDDACDIRFETTLNSIDLIAIQTISRGSTLNVVLVNENSVERLAATLNGVRVGVISHPRTLDIIGCIREGNQYIAVVVEREGNLCRVRIERQAI
jgi:hypothetical protein